MPARAVIKVSEGTDEVTFTRQIPEGESAFKTLVELALERVDENFQQLEEARITNFTFYMVEHAEREGVYVAVLDKSQIPPDAGEIKEVTLLMPIIGQTFVQIQDEEDN